MEIQEEIYAYAEGETRHSLLRLCAMAAKWKDPPRDALDKMVLEAVDMKSMESCVQTDYLPFDPVHSNYQFPQSHVQPIGIFETFLRY